MSVAVVEKRPWSGFALVGFAYVVAHVVAAAVLHALPDRHPLFAVGAANLAATVALFAFSRAFSNSSFFDAYWSVAPASMAAWLALGPGHQADGPTTRQLLILSLVFIYAARLTWNWARGWAGLKHEDWRYLDLRKQTGKLYWVVSFVGLHVFPAVMVFLGITPLYAALVESPTGFSALDVVGAVVLLGAIVIEAVADEQLRNFRRSRPDGGICNVGLWSWSRHPNYFGEINVWVGLFLFGVAASAPWWTVVGCVAMVGLFLGASIPMAEKRSLSRRPAYAEHQKKVSMLVPLPPRG